MLRQAVVLVPDRGSARPTIAGVPLVKRAIIVLARAGYERIVVAGDDLTADPEFAALATTITYVPTAVEAQAHLDGPLVLVRADRVFDVGLARAAREVTFDRDRVTVPSTAGASTAGARTDMVAGPPALLDAGADAEALVSDGRATWIAAGEALWHTAGTPDALRAAETALFRSLGKRTDGPVSRMLNRHVSTFVTRRLVNTNVTPNQMTVVANLIGALGVILVFQATWATLALGALLVQLQSILDGCDGEIARLKFKSSKIGEWLDNVLDDQVNVGYGIALGFAAAAMTGSAWWRWVGIGAGAAFTIHNLIFYAQLAFVHRSGNPFNFRWWFEKPGVDVTAMLAKDTIFTRLGGALRSLIRRDVFLFAFMGLAFAGLPQVAALWYALIAASQLGLMLVHVANGGPPTPAA